MKSILTFICTLLLSSLSFANSKTIIIVKNSDYKNTVTFEDSVHENKAADDIKYILEKMSPELKVKTLEMESLDQLEEKIKLEIKESSLRGIVFIGHGNSEAYALNKDEIYSPDKKLAQYLTNILKSSFVSDDFFLYFEGCSMAKGDHNSFQSRLFQYLATQTLGNKNIELIAHLNIVDLKGGQYIAPSIFDRFFVNSKIGPIAQTIQALPSKWLGAYGPTISNVVVAFGIAILARVTGHQDLAPLGLLSVLVLNTVSQSTSKLAKSINSSGSSKGFAYELLEQHLVRPNNKCKILFKTTSN